MEVYVKSLFAVSSFCAAVFNTHHLHFVKRSQLIPKVDQLLFQDNSNEFQEFSRR